MGIVKYFKYFKCLCISCIYVFMYVMYLCILCINLMGAASDSAASCETALARGLSEMFPTRRLRLLKQEFRRERERQASSMT